MAPWLEIDELAVIGCGNMGGGMALLFAEFGLHVSIKDPSEEALDRIKNRAIEQGFGDRIHKYTDYASLCASLGEPKLICFSLPHGHVGDSVLSALLPYLEKNDIILDAANENYINTERRQGICTTRGIRYVGMGVSGGYQAARYGPSMCPGGDEHTLRMIMPILERVAACDSSGRPCVARCGLGGSGHYVKTIHNGIEHGMMSAISEAWQIMDRGMGMDPEEISDEFERWNATGILRNTFLIKLAADTCRTDSTNRVFRTIQDKVVQDITGEEGTGVWSNMEAIRLHVPAPTLNAAHNFRLASAYRGQREQVHDMYKEISNRSTDPRDIYIKESEILLGVLHRSVYAACLASFVQGLNIIEAAEMENRWCIDYHAIWQIWRSGCIIQSDSISENILKPAFDDWKQRRGAALPIGRTENGGGSGESINLLLRPNVVSDLIEGMHALTELFRTIHSDNFNTPALSATLEYIKYQGSISLPTSFYEAQLDAFGAHMYDRMDEDRPLPTEGEHHYPWREI